MTRIDLNADVGESADLSIDAALMRAVTSVSIAAGVHAGSAATIRASLSCAHALGVAAGVHPGFADRGRFGRAEMHVAPNEIERLVRDQIEIVASIAVDEGVTLRHVKPHGALYNMAARDPVLASAIAAAVAACDQRLLLFGPPGSRLISEGRAFGLRTVAEGFADRAYTADGWLVPRSRPGAVVSDPAEVVERTLRMVLDRTVVALDGTIVPLEVETICVHSDTADAPRLALDIRDALARAGIAVQAGGNGCVGA